MDSPLYATHKHSEEHLMHWCVFVFYSVSLTTCVCVSCKCLCVKTEWKPPADNLFDLWPGGPVLESSSGSLKFLSLAWKTWQFTIKHKGHKHMDMIQDVTLGLNPWQTVKTSFSCLLYCSQRDTNQKLSGQNSHDLKEASFSLIQIHYIKVMFPAQCHICGCPDTFILSFSLIFKPTVSFPCPNNVNYHFIKSDI